MKIIPLYLLILTTLVTKAQTNSLQINSNILMPKDNLDSKNLITSLNNFLISAEKPNEENMFIFENEKIETFIQLDEIKGIGKNAKFKDDFFYKPYLTNVVLLKDKNYFIQVSFIGINENTSYLKANFEFIAHRNNNSFTFSSPLVRNTKNWKIKKIENNIFHYQNTINKEKLKKFDQVTSLFDRKLKIKNKIIEYYCCNDIIELQKLIGIDYKSDYNGKLESVWSHSFGEKKLILLGNNNETFDVFDPHDLFHDRLSLVIPRDKVNRPVDEGCAYLYGGSWGLTWEEILKEFKYQITSNRKTNWMEIKENPIYFKTKGFNNSADYIINALLVKKIEQEKGFEGVWELLTSGPFEKGNEKYYEILEKLTGFTKANYNEKIWELINN